MANKGLVGKMQDNLKAAEKKTAEIEAFRGRIGTLEKGRSELLKYAETALGSLREQPGGGADSDDFLVLQRKLEDARAIGAKIADLKKQIQALEKSRAADLRFFYGRFGSFASMGELIQEANLSKGASDEPDKCPF